MTIQTVIKKSAYSDSITLMTISTRADELAGVKTAVIGMGADINLEAIWNVGLYTPASNHATTGDLLIVLDFDDQANSGEILQQIDELFTKKEKTVSSEAIYKTPDSALYEEPDTNLVVISVNGKFATREAYKASDQQKHVMLLSDNVTVDEELTLKQKAHEKEPFVMGPDCGTAIINGAELCLTNEVRLRGTGIAGTSDTGSQEVSVQIHKYGYGVLQLIGTDGRGLSAEIGGPMMPDGLDALMADE